MVSVNMADLAAALPEFVASVRRGERVELVEDGATIARVEPVTPPDADEEDERPWRGVFTNAPPPLPPGWRFPPETEVPPPLPAVPNFSWLRESGDDE